MQFVLTIKCDGAAFTHVTSDEDNGKPNPAPEVASILQHAAEQVEGGAVEGNVLRDSNGAVVGSFRFTEEDWTWLGTWFDVLFAEYTERGEAMFAFSKKQVEEAFEGDLAVTYEQVQTEWTSLGAGLIVKRTAAAEFSQRMDADLAAWEAGQPLVHVQHVGSDYWDRTLYKVISHAEGAPVRARAGARRLRPPAARRGPRPAQHHPRGRARVPAQHPRRTRPQGGLTMFEILKALRDLNTACMANGTSLRWEIRRIDGDGAPSLHAEIPRLSEHDVEFTEPVGGRASEQVTQDLRRIAEESERAARIVRNLLAFARRQTAARVPQDVTELGSRVLSLRSYDMRLNDVELVTEFEEGLPEVVADGGQLQQALLNLILNAQQAMRQRPVRRLTVGACFDEAAGAVELSVADTGHGIDQTNLSRIFDPFFTTREVGEGTGLGLSICYGIIRDHGGEIAVDSRVDVGTRFALRLPARLDSERNSAGEILLAHADQGERDFLAAALGAWGYTVVTAARSDEALARYRRGTLHAVFLDRALLAANAAGWSSARLDDTRNIPLILLAIAGSDEPIERFGREHASAMLAPPFQLRMLKSAVREIEKHKECV